MTTILSLDSVSHQLGNKQLFENLKLSIDDKAKIGLIGPNGSGKSTLMKIMAGLIEADKGRVVSNNSKITYIAQSDDYSPELTVEEAIYTNLLKEYGETESRVRSAKYLSLSGFEDFSKKITELSGGWKKRLSLTIALAQEPELLLLDEPSNHLDLSGLLWLETLLREAKFAWVMVSHDRYLLKKTTTEICEIAPYYENGIFKHQGNYNEFIEARIRCQQQQLSDLANLKNKYRNEKEWIAKSPKARSTKATYRVKEFDKIVDELQQKKSLLVKENKATAFTSSQRQSKELVQFINVSFAYNNLQILNQQSLNLLAGSKLGILGTNGQGKSTLLKLIGGEIKPDAGKIKRAHNLQVIYFDQLREQLDPQATLRSILADGSDQIIYQGKSVHIISWAKRFGFELYDLDKRISELSGGEQARTLLSILVRQEADLLVLDEPTNDLDIPMLEALEETLLGFEGAVVLVSHDRYLLEQVCNSFLGYTEDQQLIKFAEYTQWQDLRNGISQTKGSSAKQKPVKKITEAERKEYGKIEGKILKAEDKLEQLQLEAGKEDIYSNPEKSKQVASEIKSTEFEIEALYARWEELETLR